MTYPSNLKAECAIVCPQCGEAKFIVGRKPTNREGSYEHTLQKLTGTDNHKTCEACKVPLTRGPLPEGVNCG